MAETIEHLKPSLSFEKSGILLIKLDLVELLEALQHLIKGCGEINDDGPLAIAKDELMHRLAPLNLALACAQTAKEGFQIIVGAVTFRPGIAGKEP